MSDDLQEGFNDGSWYYALMRRLEYGQHSCEMAMNSADDYHFDTLHAPFPIPMVEKVVKGVHKIKAWYEKGIDPHGKEFKRKEYSYITEDKEGLYFFGYRSLPVPFSEDKEGLYFSGYRSLPVPFSEIAARSIHTTVTFEGPTIIHFIIHTLFGKMRQLKTLLPIAPFKQYVESRWYAERSVPSFMVSFFAFIGAKTLEQDRQVWEDKIFRKKPMLMSGDGPFPAFIRWCDQF